MKSEVAPCGLQGAANCCRGVQWGVEKPAGLKGRRDPPGWSVLEPGLDPLAPQHHQVPVDAGLDRTSPHPFYLHKTIEQCLVISRP